MDQPNYKRIANIRVKTPVILQMEETECGAVALAIILAYHKKYVSMSELREACGVSRDGSRATNMLKAAQSYNLAAQAFSVDDWEAVFTMTLPCIVFWQFNHFIVVDGFRNNKIYINDPAMGPTILSPEQFSQGFTGVVLEFKPTELFKSSGKPPSLLAYIAKFLKYEKSTVSYILLVSILLVIPGILIPGFAKIFIDDVLIDRMHGWLIPLIIGMLITAILRSLCTWLEQYYLLRLKIKLFYSGTKSFLSHIFKLPLSFFAQRYSGDIEQRVEAYETLAQTLSNDMSSSLVSIIGMVFYAIVMLLISWPLALIGIFSAIVNALLMYYVSKKISVQSYQFVQALGKLKSMQINGLQIIETIKSSSADSIFFQHWAGLHARTINAKRIIAIYNMILQVIPQLSALLTTIAVLSLGAYLAGRGNLTIGSIVAMQSLVVSFNLPLATLLTLAGEISNIHGDFLRVEDVISHPIDNRLLPNSSHTKVMAAPSGAELNVEHISFGYSKFESPVISHFSLTLKNKQSIAIVGATGCGKSTIAKLISGLYVPWSGTIQYNNFLISDLDVACLPRMISIVDNDSFLFSGTIRDNLTLWNKEISDDILEKALVMACIHDELESRGGLDAPVLERGINFSGGQQQRIELARVIALNPEIIILDEATSALDPTTERNIFMNLQTLGSSLIIITHRFSVIQECDRIIVLDNGIIVEEGKHNDLIKKSGLYYSLYLGI